MSDAMSTPAGDVQRAPLNICVDSRGIVASHKWRYAYTSGYFYEMDSKGYRLDVFYCSRCLEATTRPRQLDW